MCYYGMLTINSSILLAITARLFLARDSVNDQRYMMVSALSRIIDT